MAGDSTLGGIITLEQAAAQRQVLKTAGKRVVATNGCFDLLHVGHVRYLQQARALGDFLWIGLNDDASVQELKGPGRPLNTAQDRAEILLELKCVDAVTIFSGARATEFLRSTAPDIYVKGGDYTPETLNPEERAVLDGAGSKIQIIPFVPGKSTSGLIEKMAH